MKTRIFRKMTKDLCWKPVFKPPVSCENFLPLAAVAGSAPRAKGIFVSDGQEVPGSRVFWSKTCFVHLDALRLRQRQKETERERERERERPWILDQSSKSHDPMT